MSVRQKGSRRSVITAKGPYGKSVLTAKCPYGEVSIWQSACTAKCSYGELSYGEMTYGEKSYGEKSGHAPRALCIYLHVFVLWREAG